MGRPSATGDGAVNRPEPGLSVGASALLGAVPAPLAWKDAEGRVVDCNDAFARLVGRSTDEVVGKTNAELWPAPSAEALDALERRLARSGESEAAEFSLRAEGGSRRHLRCTASPLVDASGRRSGVLALLEDITPQREAERLLEAQRDLGIELGSACGLDEALELILDAAMNVEGVHMAAIYLVDRDGRRVELIRHRGLSEAFAKGARSFPLDSRQGRMVMAGEPSYTDLSTIPEPLPYPHGEVRATAVLPAIKDGEVIASLNVGSRDRSTFTARTRREIEAVASQIGGVIARAQSEQRLRESEDRYRTLFEHNPGGICIFDATGRLLGCNERTCRMTGYTREEFQRLDPHDLFPDPADFETFMELATSPGGMRSHRVTTRRKDGSTFHVNVSVAPATWNGRDIYISINEDVTDQVRAQRQLDEYRDRLEARVEERTAELRESRRDLQMLFDSVEDYVFVLDEGGRLLHANPAAERALGYGSGHLWGMSAEDLHPPERRDEVRQIFARMLRGECSTCHIPLRTADGRDIAAETKVSRGQWDGRPVLYGISRDTTERETVERALREREQLYRSMFEQNRAVKLLVDPDDGRIVDANPAAAAFYGYDLDRLRTMAIHEINALPPDEVRQAMDKAREEEEGTRYFVFPHRLADGSVRQVEVHTGPAEIGGRTLLYSIVHDVTERLRAEHAAREAERRFAAALKNSRNILYRFDMRNDRYEYVSDYVQDLSGYTPEEFCAKTMQDTCAEVHPEDWPRIQHQIDQAVAKAEGDRIGLVLEYRRGTKDGRYVWISDWATMFLGEDKEILYVVGSAYDITDRMRAEQELRAARDELEARVQQRTHDLAEANRSLESEIQDRRRAEEALRDAHRRLMLAQETERRRLAAELHDSVSQRLLALQLRINHCASTAGGGEQREAMRHAVDQCNQLIREVRSLSRGLYPSALESIGLAAGLRQLVGEVHSEVELEFQCDEGLEGARFLREVEIALFRVAQEAVHNALKHASATRVNVSLDADEGELALEVDDDGVGFDPARRRGGSGLSTMRERIESVGGRLTIESTERGTRVHADVPASPRDAGPEHQGQA
jgi:PAS domain S-box-containing protein